MARSSSPLLASLLLAALCLASISPSMFVPAPGHADVAPRDVSMALAASAALPTLTSLAGSAEAAYGDGPKKWGAVLLPLTIFGVGITAMGTFVLYTFSEDFFWAFVPGSKRSMELEKKKKEMAEKYPSLVVQHPSDPLEGLVNRADYEKGLEEAWDKVKPKGSTVTVENKLKELSTQNNPHYWRNAIKSA
mmetsp:Transcript_43472/g.97914  ORF Transcript_43472/g.97914 Transcript_43472/m.97914 type:complete len:191 (+) Transcript_43472:90-662(+)